MIKAKYDLSELFFVYAKEFQNKRAELTAAYDERVARLERYAGSQGYEEDVARIRKEEGAALTVLQDEYRPHLYRTLDRMKEAIDKRKMDPPEDWMVNMLQILKMKEDITEEDLDRVAESVGSCGLALDVVQEIAKKHGIPGDYRRKSREMSSRYAHDIVVSLRSGVSDFIQYDTTKSSRIADSRYMEMHNSHAPMRKRPLFTTQEGCYEALCGLSGDSLDQFKGIIDADK